MSTTTINYTNLDYLRLMADGDKEMEQTMLEMLLVELPGEFEKMKILHEEKNWDELGKVSHKMKSTLAFIGNEELTNANARIEILSKNKEDLQNVSNMMAQFGNLLPVVMHELNQIAASY